MAAMYACGCDWKTMKKVIEENYKILVSIEKKPIIKSIGGYIFHKDVNLEGLTNGEKIENLMKMVAEKKNIKHISETKIPMAAVTCDTITMKECILISKDYNLKNEGIDYLTDISIAKAVRASMSFPGIYTTCNHEKYNFIDGGTKNNLPVEVLKQMGAEKVVSVSFELDDYTPSNRLFDVVIRALDIFSLDSVKMGRELSDVTCIVKTEDTSLLGIKNIDAVVEAGYKAIMDNKKELLKLKNI